ncbi:MAG: hypothetical protein HYV09_04040 [Deltaproteobacteria bacterium]|nr:hypothetical protein [Deltaproteobacteria bacterium]
MLARLPLAALVALVALVACSSSKDEAPAKPASNRPPIEAPFWGPDCDPLVPEHCGFPFPSNRWLVDDAATPTKKRVAFKTGALPKHKGLDTDPATWGDFDGFSPTGHLMTLLPYATTKGLPSQDDIGKSITKDSPTIVLDVARGELVPHFAELDVSGRDKEENTFLIRPVVRLRDASRYIVAIRRVVDPDGAPIAPSPAFAALRDGKPSSDPSIEASIGARRPLYAEIFAALEKAGIPKTDLQIAWDFSTASRDTLTRSLVHMRDDALKTVGADGPPYEIVEVTDNPNPYVRKRIKAKMTVPMYVEKATPPSKMVRGGDGLPKQNGTMDVEVLIHVPNAATKQPCALLQNGHGLLGRKTEGQNGYLAKMADRGCFVAFSVDLIGMADDDQDVVSEQIIGDIGGFKTSVDRQHQGLVNELLAMRLMKGRFVNEPAIQFDGKSAIDPTRAYWRGDSQGGIFGATYVALSTDVTRGVLGEPGAPYSMLLNRSVDFAPFFFLLSGVYSDAYDLQLALGLVQMLWDRTEPGGYVRTINEEPLPGTPKHEVLLHIAYGDHQVTPLGAHYIARAVGAKNVVPFLREVWGVPAQTPPFSGSAMVEFDFGTPEAPKENVPNDQGEDPHDLVRELEVAMDQEAKFLKEGVVAHFCDGKCDPK